MTAMSRLQIALQNYLCYNRRRRMYVANMGY